MSTFPMNLGRGVQRKKLEKLNLLFEIKKCRQDDRKKIKLSKSLLLWHELLSVVQPRYPNRWTLLVKAKTESFQLHFISVQILLQIGKRQPQPRLPFLDLKDPLCKGTKYHPRLQAPKPLQIQSPLMRTKGRNLDPMKNTSSIRLMSLGINTAVSAGRKNFQIQLSDSAWGNLYFQRFRFEGNDVGW